MNPLFLGALLSALFGAFVFAPYGLWLLAPLFPVPFFLGLLLSSRRNFKEAFKQEFLAAYLLFLIFALSNLWWISYVTLAGLIALALFYALVMALFLLLASWLVRRSFCPWLALSGCWLLGEIVMAYIFTGFPWLSLGYALSGRLVLMQAAEIGGVHFLSFALLLLGAALAQLAADWERKRRACVGLALSCLLFFALGLFGAARLGTLKGQKPLFSFRSAFVQLNLPPELKHDSERDDLTLTEYFEATLRAAKASPDLVIWPETGVPGIYNDNYNPAYDRMKAFRKDHKIPLLCGLSWAQKSREGLRFYNSAALLDNDAMEPRSCYHKKHLVIFGEYVPLEKELPFLKFLTPIAGSYSKGERSHVLPLKLKGGRSAKLGALICFEDVFPNQAREAVKEGADVLVNITNDGWFWDSPEAYQHAAIARFRAVENRRPLLRSANTGRTICYDRLGCETACLEKEGRSVLVKGELLAETEVHLGSQTFYTANGDMPMAIFGVIAVLLAGIAPKRPANMVK